MCVCPTSKPGPWLTLGWDAWISASSGPGRAQQETQASTPQAVVVMVANAGAYRVWTENLSEVTLMWTSCSLWSEPSGTGVPMSLPRGLSPRLSVFNGSQTLWFLTVTSQVLLNTQEMCVGVSVRSQLQHAQVWPLGGAVKTSLKPWLHALTQWAHYSACMILSN